MTMTMAELLTLNPALLVGGAVVGLILLRVTWQAWRLWRLR